MSYYLFKGQPRLLKIQDEDATWLAVKDLKRADIHRLNDADLRKIGYSDDQIGILNALSQKERFKTIQFDIRWCQRWLLLTCIKRQNAEHQVRFELEKLDLASLIERKSSEIAKNIDETLQYLRLTHKPTNPFPISPVDLTSFTQKGSADEQSKHGILVHQI